jgi:hypothetical protein
MPAPDAPVRYPERFRLRTPRGLSAAIELSAGRHHQTPAEFARQALLRALEQNGVRLCNGRVLSEARAGPECEKEQGQ